MQDRQGLATRVFPSDRPVDLPPVLLLHGIASSGNGDWVEPGTVSALNDAGRTVVVVDLRGHGDSPAPASAAETGAPAQAQDILAALDGVGVETFDIAGYSLGARLAWAVAEEAPARVRKVVLGGLSPVEPFSMVDIAALRKAVAEGVQPEDPFTGMIAGLVGSRGPEHAPGLALVVEGLASTPFEPKAWPVQTPPVFVVGQDDMMTQGIERIVDLVGGAELITVPGDHFGALAGAEFRGTVVRALGQ
ncbi:alpha/beta fold hydrolase [Streptosporangium carneum]|uniref:Alpha/beta hydrolase n=1 Tax=Streptosporangium carneum TaxID=47481 RepID=A0A9W6MIQ1_9ACTN|nr:alpha/beta fold hydrolase [Streptosporangium carneum]GLK15223.1 alpha/beta hydrolase [Streptosporangium carneum]